jgi:hypothetical protein
MVYVISKDGNPLMPCEPVIARLLLKAGKAKVKHTTPFTIKLLDETTEYTQPMIHGIDAGSTTVGSAVADEDGNILYVAEITLRKDIKKKMKRRSEKRSFRRYRKTRDRKARFDNRANSKREGRISPTVKSKIDSHLKEINFVKSILPVTLLIIESAIFDPHAIKNPEVLNNKWLYQKGILYGYANVKAYVRHRDKYTCQHCKGKSKDKQLEVHHIIYQINDGSDEPENLITLCKTCHDKEHAGKIKLSARGVKNSTLKHAPQMNIIRSQLGKYVECEETFGFVTSEHRLLHGLQKTHSVDAALIASRGELPNFGNIRTLYKTCVPAGEYRQTKGKHSQQKIPTGKIHGFRKFDKTQHLGKEYFIKGRMSKGYATLMDVHGKTQPILPTPKFSKMKRLSARSTWMVSNSPAA